jgi:hypothetical protein
MSDPTFTVSDAIGELVRSSGPPARQRELRAALSHVDAHLGTMPLESLRSRDIAELLDELRAEGLSERRETAILEAARSLLAGDPPVPTPTQTMLALGARAAVMTSWTIAIVFAVLFVALVLELS